MCVLEYRRTAIAMNKPPKSGLAFDADFEHPTFQGVTAPTRDTQGVASLALGSIGLLLTSSAADQQFKQA